MSDPKAAPKPEDTAPSEPAARPEKKATARPKEGGPPSEERRARALISSGVGLTLAGIALSVTDDSFPRWLVVVGIVISFIALHRYGRLGPQQV